MVSSSVLAIGLMSGTSADGVDAALVRITQRDAASRPSVATLAWRTTPYPEALRTAVLRVAAGGATTAREVCGLHAAIGEQFAAAALAICAHAGVEPAAISVIGSHGQTIWHEPAGTAPDYPWPPATLQVGQGQIIAHRTGVTTVFDFRPRDVAAGGQGAPLVPVVDYLLFADPDEGRILLNIGGIANLTVLPAGCTAESVFGFDTGPGNMLVDGAVWRLTGGVLAYDRDGEMAAAGRADERFLAMMLSEPYFGLRPPKSTGRELFGPAYLKRCLSEAAAMGIDPPGIVATLTELTVRTIASAVKESVRGRGPFSAVIAGGGGVHNPVLMRRLAAHLAGSGLRLCTTAAFGVDPDAKEAIAFALLAWLTLNGRTGNLPGVTGARQAVVLGVIAPGGRGGGV